MFYVGLFGLICLLKLYFCLLSSPNLYFIIVQCKDFNPIFSAYVLKLSISLIYKVSNISKNFFKLLFLKFNRLL
ncbi:hypothetical protein VIBNIFTn2_1230034 [Vibrio nigripulchritudo FTn2]|nr:hypothetical protein VIBNIFTn2_1230034 [Vibrio nigripulchritudo FTn2]